MVVGTTDLFVLVGGNGDELGFWERLAADHLLDSSDLHDVDPRLVLVQRVQHDLQKQHSCSSDMVRKMFVKWKQGNQCYVKVIKNVKILMNNFSGMATSYQLL